MKKKDKVFFKIYVAILIPILLIYFSNEKFSSEVETDSEWNQVAMDHLNEAFGKQSGFKEKYVSIGKWIEIENQLSHDVMKEQEKKQLEISKEITDDTLELVSAREEFSKLSLEVKDVVSKISEDNLPEDVSKLILDYYNKKLDESSNHMENISNNILGLSNKSANPELPYFPEKVVYANVTINYGGKIFGFNKVTFPVIIDVSKKEVLAESTSEQFTAVSQIVQENETHKQPSSVKVALLLLLSMLFVFVIHLIRSPREVEKYSSFENGTYMNS